MCGRYERVGAQEKAEVDAAAEVKRIEAEEQVGSRPPSRSLSCVDG